jgi:glyoxylase-like metal-dependent hydrolase (beta-lactamase superfamily II)
MRVTIVAATLRKVLLIHQHDDHASVLAPFKAKP